MMASRSFCGMSPCMADTVKLFSRILSVTQGLTLVDFSAQLECCLSFTG
jgi:hypothetical protein